MPRTEGIKYEALIRFRAGADLEKRLKKLAKERRCSVSQIVRDIAYQATEPQVAA